MDKRLQNSQKNPGGFAPEPPYFHFLLMTISKLDPDFRAGGLTHVTQKPKSIAARLTQWSRRHPHFTPMINIRVLFLASGVLFFLRLKSFGGTDKKVWHTEIFDILKI